jgi:hypothetical protein
MSAAGLPVPEDAVTKVATELFGTDIEPWRREAVEMALVDISRILYDTWVPQPRKCTGVSCWGAPCDQDEHPETTDCTGHAGGVTAAWRRRRAS